MDPIELAKHISRYTFNGNAVEPGERGYDPSLVIHVERHRSGQWRITTGSGEMVYNHHVGDWDIDYAFRQATDKTAYLTDHNQAVERAEAVLEDLWAERYAK
jgi:hypothetical protein